MPSFGRGLPCREDPSSSSCCCWASGLGRSEENGLRERGAGGVLAGLADRLPEWLPAVCRSGGVRV